jgi:signal transduction histidine kinase
MLSHDIRNPLGVILGYVDLLLETVQEDAHEERGMLERLKRSALIVHSLVINYLTCSQLEAGQITLAKRPTPINQVLRLVGQQHEAEARRRHLTLEVYGGEQLPPVEADPLALERVFANLLHNALKFTPELGRVTVRAERQDAVVVVTIADTGPGIAPEELPLLFEKYRRSATATHRDGVGLGLFIVKELVEAHDGRIEVASALGAGTAFSVFLPVASTACATACAQGERAASSLAG